MAKKKDQVVGVLTSGGDAPGMNAAIRAVVRRSLHYGMRVKGILKGYDGLIQDDVRDLEARDVSEIIQHGGTILYTARCEEMLTAEGREIAVKTLKKHGITDLVVIGGDGSIRGAKALSEHGVNVVCIPATIDMDVTFSDYAIGFDTAVNTAMEAIDKVRDTSTSHERCSIIEVMGRNAGFIALWCGIANGAEDIILPETYDYDDRKVLDNIIENRRRGKTHHIIINAEGIGDSESMARRVEAATGIETRATILGYMQRGGIPTARDRVYASIMGCLAVDVLEEGKKNRVVAQHRGDFKDFDLDEAMAMKKTISSYQNEIAISLSHNYHKTLKEHKADREKEKAQLHGKRSVKDKTKDKEKK